MKNTLSELEKLKVLIKTEKDSYRKAIKSNRVFEEVKIIYLKIKSLEKEAHSLMQQIHPGLKLN